MSPYCPTCRDGIVVYDADSGYRCVHCGRACRPLFHRVHKAACAVLVLAILTPAGLAAVGVLPPAEAVVSAGTAILFLLATLASWIAQTFEFNEESLRARWHMQVSGMERMIADLGREKSALERRISELEEALELSNDKREAVLAAREVKAALGQGDRMGLDQLIWPHPPSPHSFDA
jgi:hypothetical protein